MSDNLHAQNRKYAEWKRRLINGFVSLADKEANRDKLRDLKQADNQRVREYIYALDSVYRTVNGDVLADAKNVDLVAVRDNAKLDIFLRGLIKKFKDYM